MYIKSLVIDHLKNLPGWKTKRKIVVFSVDDYGNVRIDSKEAKDRLIKSGLKLQSHFDHFDAMETKDDLEILLETLQSVKDKHGNSAIFSAFALPCNIDFDSMRESANQDYVYELLPVTLEKLSSRYPKAYDGAWKLWQEGIHLGLLSPQFHGREHLNLKVFSEKLQQKNKEVMSCLENNSYAGISSSGYHTISFTAAFDFWSSQEIETFKKIIDTGITNFATVFGYKPIHFNAPGTTASSKIHDWLFGNGIRFIDNPFLKNEHLGEGKYRKKLHFTGQKLEGGLTNINRNVVFEPCLNDRDWVSYTIKQVEAAFRCDKPAIISSHRVNFSGHIDEKNRNRGIFELKRLLNGFEKKWPDIEYLSSEELCRIIGKESNP